MPVERPWGELLYHADPDLVPMVAVAASVESLHRMTREERDLRGLIVSGSDHLTAYNVYAEAVNKHGYLGEVYGLPRHLFRESVDRWAEGRGVLVKAIEDVALGLASVYRQLELPLPERLPHAGEKTLVAFADLVAKIQPFGLVIDEETADGREARVSRGSVCSSWGAVAGTLRYFADRFGVPRASIEGTQLPERAIRCYARRGAPTVVFERQRRYEGLMRVRTVGYFGFLLERDVDQMVPEAERRALDALPASVHLYGDRVPVDYEVEQGIGVVRLRLKEGQARRLQPRDLPPLDRPVRFTVLRGKREAVRSDSLEDLRHQLSGLSRGERQRLARSGRGGRGRGGRGGRRR